MFQFADTDSKKTTIPAGGYSIIWCSKKPERGILHTNFKLSKTGGSVYLSKIDETNEVILVDSVCLLPMIKQPHLDVILTVG